MFESVEGDGNYQIPLVANYKKVTGSIVKSIM